MQDVPTSAKITERIRALDPPITATPTAFFDLDRVREAVALVQCSTSGAHVVYAMKASYLRPLLRAVQEVGAGVSVFSEMELFLARRAGFAPGDIIYNGVGRDGASLDEAVRAGVRVNIESLSELRSLARARRPYATSASIGLRIRGTCSDLGSPEKYDLLGLPFEDLPFASSLMADANLTVSALSFHAFANQVDGARHLAFLESFVPIARQLMAHPAVQLEHINVGGGFASLLEVGEKRAAAAFHAIEDLIQTTLRLPTVFELGRFLVSDAEAVVSRVVDVRMRSSGLRVAILDATTNYLIPAPGHRFRVERLSPPAHDEDVSEVQFVDRLGSEICRNYCAALKPGSLVCVANAGAYAGVMKERFVYPLPDLRFVCDGRVVAASPAGDDQDVAAYHNWHLMHEAAGVRDA